MPAWKDGVDMGTSTVDEVVAQLEKLPQEQQQRVLEFAQTLNQSKPSGVPGRKLLRFAGTIPPDDLRAMSEAIKEGCERVDANEW
jgi:hypothetical protein